LFWSTEGYGEHETIGPAIAAKVADADAASVNGGTP
jgi:hypothetical protein